MIHVCYAIHDRNGKYSKFIGASMCSLFENTREPVMIHILHDETLTELNRRKFVELTSTYGQSIEFHSIALDLETNSFMRSSPLSPATLYRLKIAEVLNTRRAIYFDADIIINMDVVGLWNAIDDDDILGAVTDTGVIKKPGTFKRFPLLADGTIDPQKYFNAGVLVLNLDKIRAEGDLFLKTIELFRERRSKFVDLDQGLLNYFFADRYRQLDNDFNRQLVMEKRMGTTHAGKAIYHYISNSVGIDPSDEFDRLFWQYLIKTPWFDEQFLLEGFNRFQRRAYRRQQTLMIELCAPRERIFWGPITRHEAALELLERLHLDGVYLENDEELYYTQESCRPIGIEDKIVIDNLISALERSKERVAFLLTENYKFAYHYLSRRGYREGVDFFDGRVLLPDIERKSLIPTFDVLLEL